MRGQKAMFAAALVVAVGWAAGCKQEASAPTGTAMHAATAVDGGTPDFPSMDAGAAPAGATPQDAGAGSPTDGGRTEVPARTIEIKVTEKGYEPSPIKVKRGEPLRILATRVTDKTCATEIIMKDPPINQPLPLNQQVEITFTPQKSGELKYGCAMGMMIAGVLTVE